MLAFFCLPLFLGLRGFDLENDEAIYSYSVDRILESGEWLTPRAIPYDDVFLEKPPLKFWLTAGAIRAGLLPHDEFGLRAVDAALGAIAFVYVFLLGRRLAGPLCGFVSVLVLFTIDSLLFVHGIRGNQMEAPLLLAYCGGLYHFAAWVEAGAGRRRSMQALATALYFALGFMTKFVAVFFLPLVCVLALAWRAGAADRLRAGWREWLMPAFVAIAVIAPWFIYQFAHGGWAVWDTMVGEHVVSRFTGVLDPGHRQPWHFYYSQLWRELRLVGSQWIVCLGLMALAVYAWRGAPWLARLLFIWWAVPFAMLSMGTSKLFHYSYPFLPPLALGAGAAAAALVGEIDRLVSRAGTNAAGRFDILRPGRQMAMRRVLLVVAGLAIALAVWTFLAGRIWWKIDGVQIFKNSSTSRPLLVAAVLLWLGGYARLLSRGFAIAAVVILLPVMGYRLKLDRMKNYDHPLRSLRDCVLTVREPRPATHVYLPYVPFLAHSYYYYLRPAGPWLQHERSATRDELWQRSFAPAQQAMMILSRADYDRFKQEMAAGSSGAPRMPVALRIHDDVIVVTPGRFEACGKAAIAGTEREIRY